MDREIYLRIQASELRQELRQDVGGGDGGRAQADHRPAAPAALLHDLPLELQDAAGQTADRLPLWGDLQALGGADDEPPAQLLLQGLDMGAHRRLGEVQLFRRPGEAAVPHHGDKGAQVFKLHGTPPQGPPARGPSAGACCTSRRRSGWLPQDSCPASCGRRGRSAGPRGS